MTRDRASDFASVWTLSVATGLLTGALAELIYTFANWYAGGVGALVLGALLLLVPVAQVASFMTVRACSDYMARPTSVAPWVVALVVTGAGLAVQVLMVVGGGAVARMGPEQAALWCLPIGIGFTWFTSTSGWIRASAIVAFVVVVLGSVAG